MRLDALEAKSVAQSAIITSECTQEIETEIQIRGRNHDVVDDESESVVVDPNEIEVMSTMTMHIDENLVMNDGVPEIDPENVIS